MMEIMLIRHEDLEKFLAEGWQLSASGGYTGHHSHLAIMIVRETKKNG